MAEAKQIGPPVRIGDYQLSTTIEPDGVIARAVLVTKLDRPNLPHTIYISASGFIVKADNVASDNLVEIPHGVVRGLMKMAGWKIEWPDSENPNFKKEMGR